MPSENSDGAMPPDRRRTAGTRRDDLLTLFIRIGAAVFGTLILGSLAGAVMLEHQHRQTRRSLANLALAARTAQAMRAGINEQSGLVMTQFQSPAPRFIAEVNRVDASVGRTSADLLRLDIPLDDRVLVEDIRAQQAEFTRAIHQIAELMEQGRRDEAWTRMAMLDGRRRRLLRVLDELDDHQLSAFEQLAGAQASALRAAQVAAGVLAVGLAAILVMLWRVLSIRMVQPLEELQRATARIGAGDLHIRVQHRRDDELGRLGAAVNTMASELQAAHEHLEAKVAERTRQLEDLQQQLVHSTKMSALGRLVGGVAHEINNPLTAIRGFAEVTAMELEHTTPESPTLLRMHRVIDQSNRCQRIVEDLLQFTRRHAPMTGPQSLNEAVQRVIRLREYELKTHGISLETTLNPGDVVVLGDPQKLDQLILNLVNNAVDAVAESSQSLRLIEIRTTSTGDSGLLEVADNGPGIDEPDRVFEPFYTTKPPGQGTGLGLSVCYGIVAEHGGSIAAENTASGARFTVRLPRAPDLTPEPSETPVAAAPPPLAEGHLALVVDDEPSVRDVLSEYLAALGVQALTATDATEAIRSLQDHAAITLVIADLRMPGRLDGLDLLEWIRSHRPELASRFLLVSGEESRQATTQSVPRLLKPFSVKEFADQIRSLAGSAG